MRTSILALALALGACSDGGDGSTNPNPDPGPGPGPGTPPSNVTVQATTGSVFQPANAGIRTGGTVTWAFGSLGHNVTFDDIPGAPANIGGVNANTSVSRTFPAAGSFPYQCTIHPGMSGTVSVATVTTGGGGNGGGGY